MWLRKVFLKDLGPISLKWNIREDSTPSPSFFGRARAWCQWTSYSNWQTVPLTKRGVYSSFVYRPLPCELGCKIRRAFVKCSHPTSNSSLLTGEYACNWLYLLGCIKGCDFFLSFQSLSILPGMHTRNCFNAHSINKTIFSSTTFVERISSLGEDSVFNYVSLCISVSLHLCSHPPISLPIYLSSFKRSGPIGRSHVNFFRKTWYSEKDFEWYRESLVSSPALKLSLYWPKLTCLWIKFQWSIMWASLITNTVFQDKGIVIN